MSAAGAKQERVAPPVGAPAGESTAAVGAALSCEAPAHTPGPWKAVCRNTTYVEGEHWPEDEFLQWEVDGPRAPMGRGDFFQADARLIAAAPTMRAALRRMIENIDRWLETGVPAGPEESQSIYEELKRAADLADGVTHGVR